MKRTKVCVDELPKCCRKCVFCYDNRPYWKSTDCLFLNKELDEDEIETNRDKDCPLTDIKTHDRELVKEVCEKIKEFENSKSNSIADENGWHNPIRKGMTLNEFLDQIQKDIENG